jgi:hypothetical protein
LYEYAIVVELINAIVYIFCLFLYIYTINMLLLSMPIFIFTITVDLLRVKGGKEAKRGRKKEGRKEAP